MSPRHELELPDGRHLDAHDAPVEVGPTRLTLVWQHGSPRPRDGHVSVLDAVDVAMDWLLNLTSLNV